MINASAFSSCKTMSSCPMEKALKNVLWIIVSFLCGRSTSGQAWPAEPSRHIQSPLFSRCGMRSSSDLLTVLQTWTTGTAAVRHVFSRSAAVATMLAGCGSKSPARRKSFCRSTSSRTGFIFMDPGALDFARHQLSELPRACDFTAGFAQIRGSPAGAPKGSHRIFNQARGRTQTEALSQHHGQRKNLADRISRICFRPIMSGSMIGLVNRGAVRSVAGPKSQAARSGQNAAKVRKNIAKTIWRDDNVEPNCFGDILSDLGGVLAGSRGLTFGASYAADGAAVYQTNHGAAHDRAETDTANPVGQIFSLAMMLQQTFGLRSAARLIEDSVRALWRAGWRTADLSEPGCKVAGTRQFGELVAREIQSAR